MPRPMTAAEKAHYRGFFPALSVDLAEVSDDSSNIINYNCISRTVGITTRFLWPGPTIADFDVFYRRFGYGRGQAGPIAVWGHAPSSMTHGCISGPGHGPRWESKCGRGLRIQHGLQEPVGGIYGRVLDYYDKVGSANRSFEKKRDEVMESRSPSSYLTDEQGRLLAAERGEIADSVREEFERDFSAWRATWSRGGMLITSDPRRCAAGEEFDRLIAMGRQILPLVVEKLADPGDYLALQLYDALQPDEKLVIHFHPGDPRILEGEQGRAERVVRAWFAR